MSENESRRYEGQAEIRVVLNETHPEEPTGERRNNADAPKDDWQRRHSARQLCFNGLLVAFTAIYAAISFYQACATRDAVAIAARTLRQSEQPNVVLTEFVASTEGVFGGIPLGFLADVHNVGKGTAFGMMQGVDEQGLSSPPWMPE